MINWLNVASATSRVASQTGFDVEVTLTEGGMPWTVERGTLSSLAMGGFDTTLGYSGAPASKVGVGRMKVGVKPNMVVTFRFQCALSSDFFCGGGPTRFVLGPLRF